LNPRPLGYEHSAPRLTRPGAPHFMPIYQQRNSRGRLTTSDKFNHKSACLGYKFGYPPNGPRVGAVTPGGPRYLGHLHSVAAVSQAEYRGQRIRENTHVRPPIGTPRTPVPGECPPRSEVFSQVSPGQGHRGHLLWVGVSLPGRAATMVSARTAAGASHGLNDVEVKLSQVPRPPRLVPRLSTRDGPGYRPAAWGILFRVTVRSRTVTIP
jgi:hypothetical protein